MPRFGIKSLLILIAVVALWMSSFSKYPGSADIRKSILLLILVTSALMAYCTEGRRRMFWMGFFAVIFVFSGIFSVGFTPQFEWFRRPSQTVDDDIFGGTPAEYYEGDPAHDTVRACGMLFLATVAGFIGVYIYDQSRKTETD